MWMLCKVYCMFVVATAPSIFSQQGRTHARSMLALITSRSIGNPNHVVKSYCPLDTHEEHSSGRTVFAARRCGRRLVSHSLSRKEAKTRASSRACEQHLFDRSGLEDVRSGLRIMTMTAERRKLQESRHRTQQEQHKLNDKVNLQCLPELRVVTVIVCVVIVVAVVGTLAITNGASQDRL